MSNETILSDDNNNRNCEEANEKLNENNSNEFIMRRENVDKHEYLIEEANLKQQQHDSIKLINEGYEIKFINDDNDEVVGGGVDGDGNNDRVDESKIDESDDDDDEEELIIVVDDDDDDQYADVEDEEDDDEIEVQRNEVQCNSENNEDIFVNSAEIEFTGDETLIGDINKDDSMKICNNNNDIDDDNNDNDGDVDKETCTKNMNDISDDECKIVKINDSNDQDEKIINNRLINDWIFVGSTILARWKNGLFYLGVIEKVDAFSEHCLIRYEDFSLFWTHFKDLHKQVSVGTIMSDSDILCTICRDGKSKQPNEIVICDICNQGYHQKCHKPNIANYILKPDVPWTCRKCVFLLGTREGGALKTTPIGEAMREMKTVLPYDLKSLYWDTKHFINKQNTYCYCGGPGEYHMKMLQCNRCLQWFHEACIQELTFPLLIGDHYYSFTCAVCNKGKELIKRIIMKWSDMIALVLYNLSITERRRYFELQTEIIPFIQKNASKLNLNNDLRKLKENDLVERVTKILDQYKTKFEQFKDGLTSMVTTKSNSLTKKSLWCLRNFSKSTPLIFAPPFALSGDSILGNDGEKRNKIRSSSRCSSVSGSIVSSNSDASSASSSSSSLIKSSTHSAKTAGNSTLPFPLIYGACRKGASIYPKPTSKMKSFKNNIGNNNTNNEKTAAEKSLITNNENKKLKRKSCTPSVTSNSNSSSCSNRSKLSSMKRCLSSNRMKAKSNSSITSESSDYELMSLNLTLDNFIPRPDNFDGINNPFYDIDETIAKEVKRKKKHLQNKVFNKCIRLKEKQMRITNSKHDHKNNNNNNNIDDDYRVIKQSDNSSKLTIRRISSGSNGNENLNSPTSTTQCLSSESLNDLEERLRSGDKYNIIGRRLTKEGKVEYLLEWEITKGNADE